MTARRYTIAEVDQMRADLRTAMAYRGKYPSEDRLEDRLRTLLVAGASPADVKADVEAAKEYATEAYRKSVAHLGKDRALDVWKRAEAAGHCLMPDEAVDDMLETPLNMDAS